MLSSSYISTALVWFHLITLYYCTGQYYYWTATQ